MNAGAYGGEMKDVLKEVTVLTGEGEVLTLQADELRMGYRTSVVKEVGYIVLEAVISLEKVIRKRYAAVCRSLQVCEAANSHLVIQAQEARLKDQKGTLPAS